MSRGRIFSRQTARGLITFIIVPTPKGRIASAGFTISAAVSGSMPFVIHRRTSYWKLIR
jgi:hypothetical protein